MKLRWLGALSIVWVLLPTTAFSAAADPAPDVVAPVLDPTVGGPAPVAHAAGVIAPGADALIISAPPSTTTAPNGWTLTVGAKDEVIRNVNPLTTALSSRSYVVSGVFNGSLVGPEGSVPPRGVLEVGYQIGCGIDMGANGVTITGSAGLTPSLGLVGLDGEGEFIDGIAPVLSAPITGGIAVGLRPGLINTVPVGRKEFTGNDPWVSISGFQVKIDGCVGESFIRSYAVLTHATDQSDSILGYYGTIRKV
ncbi:MspA family porin [Mycolicibacterium sp. BiH015]|uniref:MspA family porin n=1 Tax=Mycolicibacterium sp. BiH015 TaxID=3018808 RepID=UPI0022E8B413|nr:MspA family porin [Mycolicibacterium sp. BiH015]MDA2894824.1 MspA family porin [Mycolicibacterium sp. BiH015]